MKDSTWKNRAYFILSTVVLVVLWKVIAQVVGRSIIIPSPKETMGRLLEIVGAPYFLRSVFNTLRRVLLGFALSFSLALLLGVISAFFDPFYYLLKPIIIVYKTIPTMAVILLALIWLDSEWAPVLVGFLVIFPVIYSTVVQSIKEIDPKLMEMAKVYQLSLGTRITKIYIPSIRAALISVAATTIGLNFKITIAAEVLSQPNRSIGTSFQIQKANLDTAGVFAWSLITILLASGFDFLLQFLEKKYIHK